MQAHYYPAPPPPKKSNTVLIVLLIVGGVVLLIVAVIVILGVLAVTGTRKYISASKAAEATNAVGQISRDAVEAYERESLDPSGAVSMHTICPSASRPVPTSIGDVCGKKYMSTTSDWQGDMGKNAGFYCLKFEMSMPQYYQYDYRATGTGKVGDNFTASAKGDLDCDSETSSFSVTGNVKAGEILVLDPMKQTDPDE